MLKRLRYAVLLGGLALGFGATVSCGNAAEPSPPRGCKAPNCTKSCDENHAVIDGEAQHQKCCTFTWENPHLVVGPTCTGWIKDEGPEHN